jgi:putative methyltransferase (TIGR04325 family)
MLLRAVGHQRTFASMEEACAFAARILPDSHDHPENIELHLRLSERARPSDYPALFYLSRILPDVHSVLDIGGSVGNLFYCYSQYIDMPQQMKWNVYELPRTAAAGRKLAESRSESRLEFFDTFDSTFTPGLILFSGSLHYLDAPPADWVNRCRLKPTHIIINRTPLTESRSTVTVQDGGDFLVGCRLYSMAEVVSGLEAAGYKLVDTWSVPELSLLLPLDPKISVPAYRGMYFTLDVSPCVPFRPSFRWADTVAGGGYSKSSASGSLCLEPSGSRPGMPRFLRSI